MTKTTLHIDRGLLGPLTTVVFIIFLATALYEFRIHTAMYGLDKRLNTIVDNLQYPERSDVIIRTHYTGIAGLDYGLRFLVTVFLPGVAPFNEYQQVQLANFLFAFFPIVVILSVEGARSGSKGSLIRYPSIWALLYQTVGGAIILPVWFLLFLRNSARTEQYGTSSVQLPLGSAKALLSTHVVGYLLPTIALFLPSDDPSLSTTQLLVANWQPSPLYVSLLFVAVAKVVSSSGRATDSSASDAQYVQSIFICSFMVAAASHIAVLFRSIQSQWSLADIFVPQWISVEDSVSELIYYIFQLDYAFIFAAAVLTAYVVIIDTRELGQSKVSSVVVIVSLILGTVFIGPGATVAAVWWWREDKLRTKPDDKIKKRM